MSNSFVIPSSSVHGISMGFQARIWKLVATSFSRGSSWPKDWTCVTCIGRWILYHWATREADIYKAPPFFSPIRYYSQVLGITVWTLLFMEGLPFCLLYLNWLGRLKIYWLNPFINWKVVIPTFFTTHLCTKVSIPCNSHSLREKIFFYHYTNIPRLELLPSRNFPKKHI